MASVLNNLTSERVGNYTRVFDQLTGETVWCDAPVWLKEDFLTSGTLTTSTTTPFTLKDTAGATETYGADVVGGAATLTLDATNEAQLAGLDFGDQLLFSLNKGVNIEAKFSITSASMTGLEFAFGLSTDHAAAVASITRYLLARLSGDFVLDAQKDSNGDGTDATAVRSNLALQTLVTATDYIFRWDCTDPAAPRLFVNNVEQTLATALDLSGLSAANAKVQPCIRVGKEAAATTLAVVSCDYITIWSGR